MSLNRNQKIVHEEYLAFLRHRPCVGCGNRTTDRAHLKARGFGEGKRNDLTAINLCRKCHQYQERHGIKRYNDTHTVDLWEEACWNLIEFFTSREE